MPAAGSREGYGGACPAPGTRGDRRHACAGESEGVDRQWMRRAASYDSAETRLERIGRSIRRRNWPKGPMRFCILALAAARAADILFSIMVTAASLSRLLPKPLRTADQLRAALEFERALRVLPLGVPALDDVLPHGGLPYGSVVELQVRGASGAATSFALAACRAAQRHAMAGEPGSGWCAFIDPTHTLFAPGVARLGVDLGRLLVVRPDWGAIERVAVRIAEAKIAAVLVIDLRGPWGEVALDHRRWSCAVRRLSLIVEQLSTSVLMITRAPAAASWALPVAMRLEFTRTSPDDVELRVGKERTGRVSPRHTISWSVFEAPIVSPELVTAGRAHTAGLMRTGMTHKAERADIASRVSA